MATSHPVVDAVAAALDQWEERNTAPTVLCENCRHTISRGKRPDLILINPLDMNVMAKEAGAVRRFGFKSQINGIGVAEDMRVQQGTALLTDANFRALGSVSWAAPQ